MPLVSDWQLFDNSNTDHRVIIAEGGLEYLNVIDEKQYANFVKKCAHAG